MVLRPEDVILVILAEQRVHQMLDGAPAAHAQVRQPAVPALAARHSSSCATQLLLVLVGLVASFHLLLQEYKANKY